MKKNNRNARRGLVLAAIALLAANTVFTQPFWIETFANQATAATNWVHGGVNAGTGVWTWTSDPEAGVPGFPAFNASTATDGYFYFDSDANDENNAHDVTLTGVGNPAGCTGKNNVHVRFQYQYSEFNTPAQAFVGVSTDGMNFTYYEVLANALEDELLQGIIDVALPEASNQPQVWLQFRWTGEWEYHFKLDDIELYDAVGPVPCDQNPMAIICDNLDAYNTANPLGPQAAWWTTWSGTEGGVEDGIVSAEQANTAPNALKIVSTDAAGGPQDVILNLDTKTTGRYELKWNMYIGTGQQGYYNIQNVVPVATGDWNLHVFFEEDTIGRVREVFNGPLLTQFAYPHDRWFGVRHVIDLDNNLIAVYVDSSLVIKRSFTKNLGGIEFFGPNQFNTYYTDDIEYVQLPAVVYQEDNCATAFDLTQYLGKAVNAPQVTGIYNNTMATAATTDPPVTCWGENLNNTTLDVVNTSMWYTFTGDGKEYHIETVPCTAASYIGGNNPATIGDTQMLLFAGDDCSDLTPLVCNEDLHASGSPDWRAGLDIATASGQNYYLLVDGFELGGVVATGEFCIQITQIPAITCADGKAGTFTLANNGLVCFGDNINSYLTTDLNAFVLPEIGPVYGLVWSITAAPVPTGTWPGAIPGVVSTIISPTPNLLNGPNNGAGLQPGQYYLTWSVIAGGTLINSAAPARVFNVNPAGGCFFNSPSLPFIFLPNLQPIDAIAAITQPTAGNSDGAIALTVTGGLADPPGNPSVLLYSWSGPNGFTANTQHISGLAAGAYDLTITDPSGCVDPFKLIVDVTTGVKGPAAVQLLRISPNPTDGLTVLDLQLAGRAGVRLELSNTLGQVVETFDAGAVSSLRHPLDLSQLANGVYLLRLTLGHEVAQRRVVLQR
ncbi:MAG: T9SS type A sorting domain-containing protein [Saprospirales bacterium]|jgi:hypothetical protein|nr:T9SS type A sorting domain-containing protein [Saprospirales bacterium]MBK8923980.1 T9SS type A sorting domain-containing protein [Saprospirales bacterium]